VQLGNSPGPSPGDPCRDHGDGRAQERILLVCVHRQAVVGVFADSMVPIASLPVGIDVNRHAPEMWQAMEQLVPDFIRPLWGA